MNPQQYYLIHSGVLGMKWGVRRYQNTDGTLTEEGKRHKKDASKSDTKNKKENLSEISDQELRTKVNRLLLEKQYKDLSANSGSVVSSGKKFLSSILSQSGKTLLSTIATGAALYVGKNALSKMTTNDTADKIYSYAGKFVKHN